MSYQHWQEISFYLDEIDKAKAEFEKNQDSQEAGDNARKAMVTLLENLRTSLEKQMEKQHTSLILFAFVAAIDEKMLSSTLTSSKVKWVPLQKDFYSAYTAGEVFFKSIDDILEDATTPTIIYEVFYAMLKRGFQGKYQDSKTQIAKYMDMLKDKIPVPSVSSKAEAVSAPVHRKRRLKRWHCYTLSAVFFILLYAGLFLTSNMT